MPEIEVSKDVARPKQSDTADLKRQAANKQRSGGSGSRYEEVESSHSNHNRRPFHKIEFPVFSEAEEENGEQREIETSCLDIDPDETAGISLHAILEKPHPTTMKIQGKLNSTEVLILVDGGSTHNFISDILVSELKLATELVAPFGVQIGNGDVIRCGQICKDLSLQVNDLKIIQDFHPFSLGGADLVLGIQCQDIEQHVLHLEQTLKLLHDNHYEFKVMPFGLTNAPSTFQAGMWLLPKGCKWNKKKSQLFNLGQSFPMSNSRGFPFLASPDTTEDSLFKNLRGECDASSEGVGAILSQNEHPVAYFSSVFSPSNRVKSAYDRAYTDTEQHGFYLRLMPYDFSIHHHSGKENRGGRYPLSYGHIRICTKIQTRDFKLALDHCLLGVFLNGLKDELKADVRIYKPCTVYKAMSLAFKFESKINHFRPEKKTTCNSQLKPDSKLFTAGSYSHVLANQPKPDPKSNLRITDAEKQNRFLKGECFRCGDKYGPGHRCKTGTFKVLEAEEENGEQREIETSSLNIDPNETAGISLHAILGKPHPTTMKIQGKLNSTEVLILVDGGSTHNFISDILVSELKLANELVAPFGVQIGNGDVIRCGQICKDLSLQVNDLKIIQDFHPFSLGGADLVLGIQWLATLNTVQANWKELFMIFTIDGKRYKLKGVQSGPQKSSSFQHLAIEPELTPQIPSPLQPIISRYSPIFDEPQAPPPNRCQDYFIPLIPNATPPNIRPYCYPQLLKRNQNITASRTTLGYRVYTAE
ncbi:retrotransposon gag domain, retroviral aspartyl protease [Tanacetum coccineum]